MKYTDLAEGINVSQICLGTMMWGDQVGQEEAFCQMDMARAMGVSFWDTAEMYTIPAKAETQGNTETIIGNYFQKNPDVRKDIILASKVVGKGKRNFPWIRGGNHVLDKNNIESALHDSLERLQTDYLDLYQVHWPDRCVNIFGERYYEHDPENDHESIESTLEILSGLVKQGKIRHIGISNETPWGIMKWLQVAKDKNLEKIITIQNPYNLLNTLFEVGCSEVCLREDVKLLAYSPLAFGVLTGKYLQEVPAGSRWDLFPTYAARFQQPAVKVSVQKYKDIAEKNGLTPAQLALAFVHQKSFVSSTIIGATNCDQLKENIESINISLDSDTLRDIENIRNNHYDICP